MVKQYEANNGDNSRIIKLEAETVELQHRLSSLEARFEMLLDSVESFPQVQADVSELQRFKKKLKDVFYEAMY